MCSRSISSSQGFWLCSNPSSVFQIHHGFFIARVSNPSFVFKPSVLVCSSHRKVLHRLCSRSSDSRLQTLNGGKAYAGLRIPDPDTLSRQNIDLVIVNKRKAVVVSVINASGIINIDGDGSWVCTGGSKHKTERLQDPIVEAKRQVAVLESYLELRGVVLPHGYLSFKIVCPNPNFRTTHPDNFPPEVVTYEQWARLKPEKKRVSGWIKGALRGGKKEKQGSIQQNLSFILGTAPMWDRLELKDNKRLFGEFLEFKGKQDDLVSLRKIKRSKVSSMIIQETSMFRLADPKLQVLYSPRDYRS